MIDLTTQMAGFALPLPAINDSFNKFGIQPVAARPLPGGHAPTAFNVLSRDPNTIYSYRHALFSADFARQGTPGIVSQRDRASTTLFMDSGGFGFIGGGIPISDIADLRREALCVQEQQADAGVIVDVPTNCITQQIAGADTFAKCLAHTQASIDYAVRHRSAGPLKLLNMIQGLKNADAVRWYEEVRQAPLDGFGFAGARRKDLSLLVGLLARMLRDGVIDGTSWFHVFGTNHPGVAILLTAVQRQLRALLGPQIRISFDSSTSFRYVNEHGQIVRGLRTSRDRVQLETYTVAQRGHEIDPHLPWPFPSPLASTTVGDFLIQTTAHGVARGRATDSTGHMLLSHQSLWGELTAIIQANRMFDMEHGDDWKYRDRAFPYDLHQAVDDIVEVFRRIRAGDWSKAISHTEANRGRLAMFAGKDNSLVDLQR